MDRPEGEATETPSEREETSEDDGPDVPPEDDRDREPAEVVEERLGIPPRVEEVPGTTAPIDHVTDEEQDIEPSGVSPGAGPDEEPGPDTEEAGEDAEAGKDDA